jgi:hypothetical protein
MKTDLFPLEGTLLVLPRCRNFAGEVWRETLRQHMFL